ncbi:MAG: type II secretion system protein [Phycisphaerae bacterium]
MCAFARRRPSAFTLIELLVVVAVIALLISILLPSLAAARERAKVARCLAQLKNLMTATQTYFVENRDTFPFIVANTGGGLGVCTWSYGGKSTDDYWRTNSGGLFYFQAHQKPLNRYIQGADVGANDPVPVMQCPSDVSSFQRQITTPGLTEGDPFSCYDDIGTSYQFNFHALDTTGGSPDPWVSNGNGWQQNLRKLLRDGGLGFSSRLVWYFENPHNYGIRQRVQTVGNHRQFSVHSVGMLDGHAEYRLMDSRKYCGPGWYVINPLWVWRVGQTRPIPTNYPLSKQCD